MQIKRLLYRNVRENWDNIMHKNDINKSKKGHKTATRHTLDQSWQDNLNRVDWMHAPTMPDYVNSLVSNKSLNDNGHWAIYAKKKYIDPLYAKYKGNLSMVSLACGSGHIEESLIKDFGWPLSEFIGLEYDDKLRAKAAERFNLITNCQSDFIFFDFNKNIFPKRKFNIVFTCHSIHHAADLEGLMEKINQMLKPDGLFIGIDFFGPTRFQIEHDVLPIIQELFTCLPEELRHDLSTPHKQVRETFDYASIETVRLGDISESVRSSDLRTLLFSTFPVIEIKPMGGTLLRWLLNNRSGNFVHENPCHVAIIKYLQFIERELISLRRIKSDDLFFVLGKSEKIKG